jgi:predicted nucleotidyltransferase
MSAILAAATLDLPSPAAKALTEFVEKAREVLGPDLRSVVLYGSAAEGRLRTTSDLNVIVVLDRFEAARMDQLREVLRLAQAAASATERVRRSSRSPSATYAARRRREAFLARIYVDDEARRLFLAEPREEAARAGLDEAEQEALTAVDRVGLELAARSFSRKRAEASRRGGRPSASPLLLP